MEFEEYADTVTCITKMTVLSIVKRGPKGRESSNSVAELLNLWRNVIRIFPSQENLGQTCWSKSIYSFNHSFKKIIYSFNISVTISKIKGRNQTLKTNKQKKVIFAYFIWVFYHNLEVYFPKQTGDSY